MPKYQYACTECGHDFEVVQSFSEDSLTDCPQCEGRLRKLFNAVGIVFKGSGFYRTDSRSGSVTSGNGSSSSSGSDSGSSGSGSSDSSGSGSSGSSSSGASSSGSGDSGSSSGSSGSKATASAS
ncbi:FmdB family transcriptional regulator [Allosaccharopolyspora coralli]|uniref:FmdB family transcriptional regulator n=1 Tax=Allosaccharopolyspora coralli TaxID=2665642 RepID=A0A5Q3Q653_9PSEU|nr:FmdB family transcriptional regulator [Allosaccharopolyspora coralli]